MGCDGCECWRAKKRLLEKKPTDYHAVHHDDPGSFSLEDLSKYESGDMDFNSVKAKAIALRSSDSPRTIRKIVETDDENMSTASTLDWAIGGQ
jgi:hypothetical protein